MFLFPNPCLLWCQHRGLLEQSPDTIKPLTSCGMKPSEVADPGKAPRQDMLKEPPKELLGIERDVFVQAAFAIAVVPKDLAFR